VEIIIGLIGLGSLRGLIGLNGWEWGIGSWWKRKAVVSSQ